MNISAKFQLHPPMASEEMTFFIFFRSSEEQLAQGKNIIRNSKQPVLVASKLKKIWLKMIIIFFSPLKST